MNIIGIIPARMASTRFPNKPMANIFNMPMIGHCYYRIKMSEQLDEVYVATCDEVIFNYIHSIGGKAIMTSNTHERACDRAGEALLKIEKAESKKIDIVVMLQGDEPMITSEMIKLALEPLLKDQKINISNLYTKINSIDEFNDPNEVKVIVDKNGFAIYFSREPIPSRKKGYDVVPMYKQVCTIPFRRDFLLEFNKMSQTDLEIIESIDMNRIIENGKKVKMIYAEEDSISVDTKEDLARASKNMENDPLLKSYL